MKKKLVYLGWLIYRDIIQSGLQEGDPRDHRKKVLRLNQFVILALLMCSFSVLFYFYQKLYISALTNITSAYFFLLAYYFNSRRKLITGRIISIVNMNVYLIAISYVNGLQAGEY